jgi:hypothetical protein
VKVAELQKFILSMGEVMQASGASSVGKELAELAGALDYYKDKTLLGLRDVLNKGRDNAEGATVGGRRPRTEAKPDEAKIEAALQQLRTLQARALDPALNREAIETVVRPFEKQMSGEELNEVARRFGIAKKQGSKGKTVAAIIERIAGQKGVYARGQE